MLSWGGRGSLYSYIDLAILLIFDYLLISKYGFDGVLNILSNEWLPKEFMIIQLFIFAFTPIEALCLFIEDTRQKRTSLTLGEKSS